MAASNLQRRLSALAAALASLSFVGRTALAHDYWMVPRTPIVMTLQEASTVPISLYVGEDLVAEEEKKFEGARTPRLVLLQAARSDDVRATLAEGAVPFAHVHIREEGGHLLVLDRNASQIELPAAKFERYLRHEGLTRVLDERVRRGESSKPGRERYTRCLKALIQVGAATDETFGREVGQTLELIPKKDPVRVEPGGSLPVLVTFHGQPLAGARIEGLSREGADVRGSTYTSDEHGVVQVKIDRPGLWLVRMVHMVRCEGCADADWESTWASYVFATMPTDGRTVVSPSMLLAKSERRGGCLAIGACLAIAMGAFVLWRRRRARLRVAPESAPGDGAADRRGAFLP